MSHIHTETPHMRELITKRKPAWYGKRTGLVKHLFRTKIKCRLLANRDKSSPVFFIGVFDFLHTFIDALFEKTLLLIGHAAVLAINEDLELLICTSCTSRNLLHIFPRSSPRFGPCPLVCFVRAIRRGFTDRSVCRSNNCRTGRPPEHIKLSL